MRGRTECTSTHKTASRLDATQEMDELDVLHDVTARLEEAEIPYMLTGSMAMNYYAEPRMTRDIDLVVDLQQSEIPRLTSGFQPEYHVSLDFSPG